MKNLFLVLTFVGAIAPLSALAPWVVEHGLDLGLLISHALATPVSRFLSIDLFSSALVLSLLSLRGIKRGVPLAWLPIVATVAVGVSMGLPLYLYLEARHEEASGSRPEGAHVT